jgi:hypothetical protein
MTNQSDRVKTTPEERHEIERLAEVVFEYGFDDYRIFRSEVSRPSCIAKSDCEETGFEWENGRKLRADDLRITQVWSKTQDKAAHLGQPTDGRHYRLGIRFKSWRRYEFVYKLSLIIHELGHLVIDGSPHGSDFWNRIADATARICERRDEVQAELGETFSPHILKNDILAGIRYADGLDEDRDVLLFLTAKRLEYPPDAVGNMTGISVGANEYATEKADTFVPVDELQPGESHDLDSYDDRFVWARLREMSAAGRTAREFVKFTNAIPVTEDDGVYTMCGYSTDWQAIAIRRVYEHTLALKGDRASVPEVPVVIQKD